MTLAAIALAAFAAPVLIGMFNAPNIGAQSPAGTRFDVASVKPTSQQGPDIQGLGSVQTFPGGRLSAEKALLRYLIQNAYGVKPFQLSGGPASINSAHYDIDTKAEGNPSPEPNAPDDANSPGREVQAESPPRKRKRSRFMSYSWQRVMSKTARTEGGKLDTEPDPNESSFPPAPVNRFHAGGS